MYSLPPTQSARPTEGNDPVRVYGKTVYATEREQTDEAIIRKALAAKNGQTFQRYYEGDTSLWEGGKHRSQSEADYQLCLYLLYWSGDVAQADRLFRQSGLMRDKWDRPLRGTLTYGQFTLTNAAQKGKR